MAKRYKIFQITAPLVLPNQGDADYTHTLNNELQKRGVRSVYPLPEKLVPQVLIKKIRQEKVPGIPLIGHVQLRPPNGGTLLSPEQLTIFDCTVLTVHEFIHLRSERELVLAYIKVADHVVFSTPYELAEVEKYLPDIRQKSTVIPIFPSIPVMNSQEAFSNARRPPNIIHFSSIRAGKGHGDLIRLGLMIRDDPELKAYQEKNGPIVIHMVGNPTNPRLCIRLIGKIYGIPDEELPKVKNRSEKSNKIFADFMRNLEESGIQPRFPIKIMLNSTPEEIQDICRNCNFAYLPIMRGATHHSTAVPVLMSNGCVTITTMGGHTPDGLKSGAVVFADAPADALKTIKQHIKVPQRNRQVRREAEKYVKAVSAQSAAEKYENIYESLIERQVMNLRSR